MFLKVKKALRIEHRRVSGAARRLPSGGCQHSIGRAEGALVNRERRPRQARATRADLVLHDDFAPADLGADSQHRASLAIGSQARRTDASTRVPRRTTSSSVFGWGRNAWPVAAAGSDPYADRWPLRVGPARVDVCLCGCPAFRGDADSPSIRSVSAPGAYGPLNRKVGTPSNSGASPARTFLRERLAGSLNANRTSPGFHSRIFVRSASAPAAIRTRQVRRRGRCTFDEIGQPCPSRANASSSAPGDGSRSSPTSRVAAKADVRAGPGSSDLPRPNRGGVDSDEQDAAGSRWMSGSVSES